MLISEIEADAALGWPVDRLALLHDINGTSLADPNWKPNRHTRLNQAYAAQVLPSGAART